MLHVIRSNLFLIFSWNCNSGSYEEIITVLNYYNYDQDT